MLRGIVLVLICFLAFGFKWPWDSEWTGFFYQNGNMYDDTREGPFKSKEECLDWARGKVRSSTDQYECGKDCKPMGSGMYRCKVTVDS